MVAGPRNQKSLSSITSAHPATIRIDNPPAISSRSRPYAVPGAINDFLQADFRVGNSASIVIRNHAQVSSASPTSELAASDCGGFAFWLWARAPHVPGLRRIPFSRARLRTFWLCASCSMRARIFSDSRLIAARTASSSSRHLLPMSVGRI